MDAQQDFVDTNQLSTSGQVRDMPKIFEQLIRRPPTKKVSKLKEFLKSCLELIHEKYVIVELTTLIEDNTRYLRPKRRVNQVGSKCKTGQDL